ncbi:MAG: hypothetical protein EOP22_05055 [Hyphomicrobiales bacterium]|nr:MAG: hypothetical protein EOP22_05055 [Hyphomicrobiales bacterium]
MGAIDSAGAVLAPMWAARDDRLLLLSQASHAYAIIRATLAAAGRPDPVFWFPSYFCGSALDSFRLSGPKLRFYPVTDDFAPDWAACTELARAEPPDLFSLPHFFGLEADLAAARAFADRHGALLHEDCAHSLLPYGGAGRAGDFVTYSPRKFLPMADGGLLIVRGEALIRQAEAAASGLPGRSYSPLRWQWRQWRRRLLGQGAGSLPPRTLEWDPPIIPHFPEIWMSRASRSALMLAAGSGAIAAIAARRHHAALELGAQFAADCGLRHLPPHPDAVPFWTALRGPDEATTLAAINALRAKGVGANTWPRLPVEVKADPARYAPAIRIRRTLIRIPTA